MNRILSIVVAIHLGLVAVLADERQEDLVDAARRGDLQTVKQLVADGVDVNSTSSFKITPLWQATSKGHLDVIRHLLEAGADPNIRDEVWLVTPLMLTNQNEIVSLLVKHGAKGANAKLRLAAFSGSIKLVRAIGDAKRLDEETLAAAKAQAKLRSHTEIAKLLDEIAGKELPRPPKIDKGKLQAYTGKYTSERLDEVEMSLRGGQLTMKMSGRSPLRLIPKNERAFYMGLYTFEFQFQEGKVTGVTRSTPSSKRVYSRVSANVAKTNPVPKKADDWTLDNDVAAKNIWPSFRGPHAHGICRERRGCGRRIYPVREL